MRIPLTILLLPFFLPVMGLPASSDKANKGKAPAEEDTHAQSVNYYEIEAYKSFSGSECTDSVVGGGLKVPKSDSLKRHELMAIQAHCLRFIIPFPPDCCLYVNEVSGSSRRFRKEYPAGYKLQFPKSFDHMSVECGFDTYRSRSVGFIGTGSIVDDVLSNVVQEQLRDVLGIIVPR
ncbi:uncharacterized protein C8R40DRAFT_1066408 [Lentinula edodes]|uniref:uncharacterized protein n=1 Tax=Lentinula edodes TaxID=5353 RepID=UPI001E8E9BF5|nr:uncharacterized protein C8R40DRAFT_1066408 [Lentinula edodes]KAH7879306.1 hypothetical protein C8R40DRAFT_1066408 [Lentinula edodes]